MNYCPPAPDFAQVFFHAQDFYFHYHQDIVHYDSRWWQYSWDWVRTDVFGCIATAYTIYRTVEGVSPIVFRIVEHDLSVRNTSEHRDADVISVHCTHTLPCDPDPYTVFPLDHPVLLPPSPRSGPKSYKRKCSKG